MLVGNTPLWAQIYADIGVPCGSNWSVARAFRGDEAKTQGRLGCNFFKVQLHRILRSASKDMETLSKPGCIEKHILIHKNAPGELAPRRPAWALSLQFASDRPRSPDLLLGSNASPRRDQLPNPPCNGLAIYPGLHLGGETVQL